eukprot:15364658-Ditylum_brightwellii.AAC.1
MARQYLLLQQHLVGLHCVDETSKKLTIIYLPKVEVTIDADGDTDKKWITGTTLDAAGKLQLVKVLASQPFYNLNELARPFDDCPPHLMGDIIKSIPEMDNMLTPLGNKDLCVASLLYVTPVSYEHGLTAVSIKMHHLELMEDYHE